MVQEAWAAVLEALPEVDVAIGSPEQYLIQCARWRVLDSIKRARVRRCDHLSDIEPLDPAYGSQDSVFASACVSEFCSMLRAPQRAVLECLLAGLTWRETGSALGCTSANVAYYVRQIKRRYVEWSGHAP